MSDQKRGGKEVPGTEPLWVLIHSPLTSPMVWALVAADLRRRGHDVHMPDLADSGATRMPYWERHARGVALDLTSTGVPASRSLILAGHSGAGPLLPAIAHHARRPIAAYLFVDAGIPVDGKSRLDLMADEDRDFALMLEARLALGSRFPAWSSADLVNLIPDEYLREQVVDALRPRDRAFFAEPLFVPAGWPDAPCAYLQFSAAYDVPAARARREGWPVAHLDTGHFHMLVDPATAADALVGLVRRTRQALPH